MSERSPLVVVGDQKPDAALSARVRELLAGGGLCALPTETVYGLAARAERPAALERLRRVKGRPSDVAFTWHVAERGVLESFARLRPLALRLAERYWPGPLTLVLAGVPHGLEAIAQGGWTGVRLPAHAATNALLAACEFPVVMTSANLHGDPACVRAEDVARTFADALDLVVDGGPSRLGEASGVLALGPGRFEVLRRGLLEVEDLRRAAGLRLAFVCTGNTCRSPMAEALARKFLAERLGAEGRPAKLESFGFEVLSLGVHAALGSGASPGACEVLAQRGLDLGSHRARSAVPEVLARMDWVYGLAASHVEALRALLPPARRPALSLLDPDGRDIADPIGGPRASYERAASEIERALRRRLDEWA